jgi:mono/diheme cytochrome c family protein
MLPSRARRALGLAAVALSLLARIGSPGEPAPSWPPARLRDAGLYSDWSTRTIAPENLPFSPQYPLWSDGAAKSRWMRLPAGTFIDASNPDVWRFPVGTRFWKEFRFNGRRAETRFIEHTRSGWQFAAYAWNEDESDAVLVPEDGIKYSVPITDDVRHAIPARADCRACHEGGPLRALGVTALQLSPDRDPNAPHAEIPPADAVTLPALIARGLVRGLPPRFSATPPRIAASTPTARAALGYLQANCGHCHTGAGELKSLGFALNYTLARAAGQPPPAVLTSVGQASQFKLQDTPDIVERVCAGLPDKSVLVARMASRHPVLQMPPLGTRIVDEQAVQLVRRWIAEDLRAAGSRPHPQEQR